MDHPPKPRPPGRVRKNLREEEGGFRSLVENALEGIAVTQGGIFLFVNPAFLRMFGYDAPGDVVGKPISLVIAPESRDYVLDLSRRREAGEETMLQYEFWGLRKGGQVIDVEVRASRVTSGGKPGIQAALLDVTESKRLEAQVKSSMSTLKRRNIQLAALNATVQVLSGQFDMGEIQQTLVAHLRGSIRFDHASVSLLEDERHIRRLDTGEVLTAPGVIGQAGSATDWVVGNRRPLIRTNIPEDTRFRVSDRTRASGILSDVILPLISRDRVVGTLSLASRAAGVYQASDLEFLQPVADQLAVSVDNARLYRDLNRAYEDLKSVQSQLVESEKLRALGDLAAGVAHNFNNLLTGVLGFAQLLQIDPDPVLREQGLRVIEKNAREGAQIAKEMQEFARSESTRPFSQVDLNRLIQRSLVASESRWRDARAARGVRVEVKTRLGDIPPVSGDDMGLGKVISNLIVNASEAMPEGGTITITTDPVEDAGTEGSSVSWVRLTVSDTGQGMSEEERRRVFEPFFTTKGPQVGHGMGLSAAYGIILRHQGRIDVASEAGRGTRFTVWLPAFAQDAASGQADLRAEDSPEILVIDDDVKALELLYHALKPRRVEVAEDGEKGLALFEERRHPVVFTDLGMPGLNGWDVAKAVRRKAPETRVFLITAWDVTMSPEQLAGIGVEEILRKPFDLDRIRGILGAILPAKAPGGDPCG